MSLTPWFSRTFPSGAPADVLPPVLERLRGTPARLEERLAGVPEDIRTARVGDTWSVQRNVGHLLDLEPLWAGRLDDFLAGSTRLRPADLTNRGTHEADHDGRPIADLLADFRRARRSLVARLDALGDADRRRTARHPRLDQPMTLTDFAFFVAEHDDHHLARITQLLA